jgi:hypothetical protein
VLNKLLRSEREWVDWEKVEAKLSELKENSAPAARLFEKLTPNAATIFTEL